MMNRDTLTHTPMQREILRALEIHGGITPIMSDANGWTRRGMPVPEMRMLIDTKVISPRVLTSQPLKIVWQLRAKGAHKPTLAKIEQEAKRLRMKEYATGGFRLTLREELKGKILENGTERR